MAKFVSKFTGQEIDNRLGEVSGKFGAEYWMPGTFRKLNFASQEDLQTWLDTGDDTLILSESEPTPTGTVYRVNVNSKMTSDILYFTTQADKAEVTVSLDSQQKGVTDSQWEELIEDYYVSVLIDKGSTGTFVPVITDQFIMGGKDFTFDIRKALATGANRVRVVARGTESEEKGSKLFNITLTSMYLAPSNFTWYKPFIEGETYVLGGMNIGGSGLNKILKIKVSKEGYEKLYEIPYGTGINTDTAYTFNGLEFPEAGTGVYNVELWLDANGLESEHLSYNIICVSQADKFTAQLVAIGSPAKVVYNFSDNKLFEYSIYNGGTATGSPHIKVSSIVNTNPTVLINEDLVNVATASPLTYTASLEIEMEDESATLQLEAFMTYGNEQQIIYPVDNSKSYPATTGAVFYMNPSARNNAQSNREKVINSITGAEIDAVFTRMAWTDGTDGWTTDEEGRKCLRLPAGCTMDLAYQPMASVAQKTIELVYKVKNAADYDEPIFSICSDVNDPNFRGIVIRPKNILIHSRDLNVNDSLQDYNTTDEETLHVLITIVPNYKTNYGNLAQIYVNGTKVRSFSFETADRWDVAANMKFGSETADTYWYKARVYDKGFETYDAQKNTINALPSTAEKEALKAKIEAPLNDSYKLSYDDCVKNGLNTMVIEILDQDQTVPSISNPSAKQCNLWVKINNPAEGELDEDFARFFSGEIIENQTIEGQGTTAMTYARWNFRWKLTSAYNKRRITAKKNFASSMHSHKMGATRLFNDLHEGVVGANEAGARVAVYQYPVYGFQKIKVEGTTDQYLYEPIGLYTIGPDKGDKATFGFDDERFESTLIHMEGTDHTPKGVGMDYPWEELAYSGSAEALGAVNATGSVVAAWEVGAAGEYDPKDNPTEVKAMLDAEFKPAYDVAEKNSTYILGVTETLAEINADIASWQAKTDAEGRSYATLEFFTDGVYDLYFYNARTQQYAPRGINMLTDLGVSVDGLTLDEKTELFKTKRRERFMANWETYWHKNDAIFHYAFVLIFAATDNFKKNTYPYKFKAIADGGKYRWRQDDLDTLFDINNQGLAAKIYSILVGDKTDTGSGSIYRGDTSVFWTLIKECFPTEVKAMVHAIFDKMVELCPASYGKNTLDKLVGCVRYYFWDKAQAYFPSSAYNADAEWTYEDTWAAGLYKEVNPLSQSLGGHYEAERDWVTMRVLFTAMYYNYGPFGAVNDSFSDTSTGQIAYGGAGAHTFAIEMACDGNPTILRGQSELVTAGRRVKEGDIVEITVPDSSGADTRIYIQGVDWMKAVGDLSTLQVSADNPTLSLASKRMQNFKIGDEDASKVTTNVQGLTFGDCPSMMIVDARNAKSLTGSIDLSKMPRLLEAYFGGTAVKSVNVPNGSKIVVLQIGEETTQVSLMNLKFMEGDGFQYTSLPKLEFVRIENCSQLSPFQLLKSIYNTDGNVIRDIRVIGFDVEGDASDVAMIANMANDVDKDGNEHIYNGIDAEGKPMDNSHPVIEGKLSINGNIYEDDYAALKAVFPNLDLSFLDFYVAIKDPEVLRVLLENITTDDGVGLTTEDIEGVTSFGQWFLNNTVIETFNELSRFTSLKTFPYRAFYYCTSLKSIELPYGITSTGQDLVKGCSALERCIIPDTCTVITKEAFFGCSSLKEIGTDLSQVTEIRFGGFGNCKALAIVLRLPNLNILEHKAFLNTSITRIEDLGNITALPNGDNSTSAFWGCTSLTYADISKCTVIGKNIFRNCTALSEVVLSEDIITEIREGAFFGCPLSFEELNLPNLTTLDLNAFYGVKIKKLVLGKVTSLPSSKDNYVSYGDKTTLVSLTLPDTLTSIASYAFMGYSVLAELVMPDTITAINDHAFYNALSGNELVFPNVTTIGTEAFRNSKIKSISLPSYVGEVLASTFRYSKIEKADFGEGVTAFNGEVFSSSTLSTLIIRATTPPTLTGNNFYATPIASGEGYIYVPAASIPSYAAATNWSTYASRLAPLEDHEDGGWVKFADSAVEAICVANWDTNGSGYMSKNECAAVTSISNALFKGNAEITSFDELKYFTGVKSLAQNTFNGCTALESIGLDNIEVVGNNAVWNAGVFAGCTSLKSAYMPNATSIANYAFYNCTALTEAYMPNVETTISSYAFANTSLGGSHTFPKLVDIGASAFAATNVVQIIAPCVVTFGGTWDNGSFKNCKSLKKVMLRDATTLGERTFLSCTALESFVFANPTPPSLNASLFSSTNSTFKIYVPDSSVDAYKAATNWSTFGDRIVPISQLAEDDPTFYAEIEEYL